MIRTILTSLVLALILVPTSASAQPLPVSTPQDGYLAFDLVPDSTFQFVSYGLAGKGPGGSLLSDVARFNFQFYDRSYDPNQAGGAPVPHKVQFSARMNMTDPDGWKVLSPPPDIGYILSGPVPTPAFFDLVHDPATRTIEGRVILTANMSAHSDPTIYLTRDYEFVARIFPSPAVFVEFASDLGVPLTAEPNTFVSVPVRVYNNDLYLHKTNIRARIAAGDAVDPDQIPILIDSAVILDPKESRVVNLSFRTPKETFWYRATPLSYSVTVYDSQDQGISFTASGIIAVDGFYFPVQLWIIIPLAILALILLILVLILAKRHYEERILGKPIPPWRIPEEAAALAETRVRDPRAFYLLRYFVMEQEYQSALNWFDHFKRRSKREIQAQSTSARYMERAHALESPSLVRFDRRAERIRRRMQRRQQRQKLKAENKVAKLQAKLDQHYEEDFEKTHEKWAEQVEKIKKKANKPWYKEHKKWEVQVEKIQDEWEKPFRKEKAKHEKALAKAKDRYEGLVKKEDKSSWRDWRDAVDNAEAENKVRGKEGRDLLPLPELFSKAVGPPELPESFQEPPPPKLPAEPKPPKDLELPPEPTHDKPLLSQSRYARKERRVNKKADRKVRRLEKKLNRLLARNERDRVKALAKADRRRRRLLRKSERVLEPGLLARLLHRTPEDRERRNAKRLQKALAKERVRSLEEAEQTHLEVLDVEARRREAEAMAKLIRDRAAVRKGSTGSGMSTESVSGEEADLKALRSKNQERLAKERAASEERLAKARAKIEEELQASTARAETKPPSQGSKPKSAGRSK